MNSVKILPVVATISVVAIVTALVAMNIDWESGWDSLKVNDTQDWQNGFIASECWFTLPEDRLIQCGHFHTSPENGGFSLPIVIIRDRSADHRNDPLVYLSGGPGSATGIDLQNIERWYYWVDEAHLSRDLILVDQRGTGLSEPSWQCQSYESMLRDILKQPLGLEQEYQTLYQDLQRCMNEVRMQGFNLEHYSTTYSADDMQSLMQALQHDFGYQEWNIIGVSYGTRLAMEWMRRDPESIRAAVLDSSYPFDKGLLNEWPALLNNSLQILWESCSNNTICSREQQNNLEDRFWRALELLRSQPQRHSVSLWHNGWPVNVVLNDGRFLGVIYSALYDRNLHGDIINAVDDIVAGRSNSEALENLLENSVNSEFAPNFNTMVYMAVECQETPRLSEAEFERDRARYPQLMRYTEFAWQYSICRDIEPRKDLANFREPFASNIPALLLNGALDPVTPPRWSEGLQSRLSNSQRMVFEDIGHSVVASSACAHGLLRPFLDRPNQPLQYACE